MAVRRNFFEVMRSIDSAISKGLGHGKAVAVFRDLCAFIEDCSFSNSKNSKFLCENWRYTTKDLQELWQMKTGKVKSVEAFRSQISELSSHLYEMFPSFSRELFIEGKDDEESDKAFSEIMLVVDSVGQANIGAADIFISEVVDYPDSLAYEGEPTVESCEDALVKLKPLLKREINNYLDEVDTNQLHYLLTILSQPLFQTRGKEINHEKLRALKQLGILENQGFEIEIDEKTGEEVRVVERIVEVPESIPFTFEITKHLSDMLIDRLKMTATDEETRAWTNMSEDAKNTLKQRVYRYLAPFTEEGFKAILKFNIFALREVIQGIYGEDDDGSKSFLKK